MTDTDTPTTPAQLLHDLGELHTRTLASPLPKHPAAMGWQVTAGAMAAGFARALHALHEVAPDKAAEVAEWFDGPLGEGPDPEEHTDWLERTVARGPELLERWVEDGRRMAVEAQAAEATPDTLPAWLHWRFGTRGQHAQTWEALTDDDRAYWEHQARAVRRAVDRGGFKQPAAAAQQGGARP